jgi:hypothetical protein
METINITPTWEETLVICLALLQAGNPEGKKRATEELRKMAKLADAYVAENTEKGQS